MYVKIVATDSQMIRDNIHSPRYVNEAFQQFTGQSFQCKISTDIVYLQSDGNGIMGADTGIVE